MKKTLLLALSLVSVTAFAQSKPANQTVLKLPTCDIRISRMSFDEHKKVENQLSEKETRSRIDRRLKHLGYNLVSISDAELNVIPEEKKERMLSLSFSVDMTKLDVLNKVGVMMKMHLFGQDLLGNMVYYSLPSDYKSDSMYGTVAFERALDSVLEQLHRCEQIDLSDELERLARRERARGPDKL